MLNFEIIIKLRIVNASTKKSNTRKSLLRMGKKKKLNI
jgi:hypothetical protein